MDNLVVVLTTINGMLLGILLAREYTNRELNKSLAEARKELDSAATSLHALHNEQATKLIELGEKVAAHEYQLMARVSPKRPVNPFEARQT